MKLIFSILALSGFTFAAVPNYNVQVKFNVDDQEFTQDLVLRDGQKGSVVRTNEQDKYFVDVTPVSKSDSEVKLNLIVGKIDSKGRHQVLSTPQIITVENKKAEVAEIDDESVKALSIEVVAKKTETK